jgi:hypothetical protein
MEPRREELQKALKPNAEQKPNRFRIVKLEDRIAPAKGGNGNHGQTHGPSCACWTVWCDPTW